MELSAQIVRWLTSLRVNKFRGEPRPHKPVLLLAVLELVENDYLQSNAIPFSPRLFEYFGEYWRAVTGEAFGRVQYPFWHLDSEPFWHLVPKAGYEAELLNKRQSPSVKQIHEWVRHARLDDELFEAVLHPALRDRIRGVLVASYFPDRKAQLEEIRSFEQSVYRYTQIIRRWSESSTLYQAVPAHVRDAAFRRVVTEAYDYTCAVSGARLTLSAGGTYQLVQAAHIHDWAVSHDDAPQNGIALSPNYHWLFERGLFTLDESRRVKVSPVARDCVGTTGDLLTRYNGRRVRLPADAALGPGDAYLAWHRANKFIAG